MWMWNDGIAHNVAMATGWLLGLVLLGGIVYFAASISGRDETAAGESDAAHRERGETS